MPYRTCFPRLSGRRNRFKGRRRTIPKVTDFFLVKLSALHGVQFRTGSRTEAIFTAFPSYSGSGFYFSSELGNGRRLTGEPY